MQSLTALVGISIIIIITESCGLYALDHDINETCICYEKRDLQKTKSKFYTVSVMIHCEFSKPLHDEISLPSCRNSVIIFFWDLLITSFNFHDF